MGQRMSDEMARPAREAMDKSLAVLTGEQRQRWHDMTGKPFKGTLDSFHPFGPGFGGRGGFGGFGPGGPGGNGRGGRGKPGGRGDGARPADPPAPPDKPNEELRPDTPGDE